jgi:predicted nucleotidyltransferase
VVSRRVSSRESRVAPTGVHPKVREVADAPIEALGDDLKALLWHGSFARGEPRPDSDHDLIVILRRADDSVLLRMREVFRDRAGWSAFVKTEDELRQYPPTGRLQFHFGIVPLYGEFEPPPWTRESLLDDLRDLAGDISFECRYRLLNKQPGAGTPIDAFQRRRNLNMLHYAAKWAVLALKARELLDGHEYPATLAELRERLSETDELAIVDLVARWKQLAPQPDQDIAPLALQLDAFARKLVSRLPHPATESGNSKGETRRPSTDRVSRREFPVSKGRG